MDKEKVDWSIKLSKIITKENYYEPCDVIKVLGKIESGELKPLTEKDYIQNVKDIQLNSTVPSNVILTFETAKALYVYGYLYWTFFTLSIDQGFKAFEMAVNEKLIFTDGEKIRDKTLNEKINILFKRKIITLEQKDRYHILREFRNSRVHPSEHTELGHHNGILSNTCKYINLLYPES